jgi:hypothetical protein
MNASVEIDQESRRKMEKTLLDFSKMVNRSVEEGIKDIARSSVRRLIHTVRPYGTKENIGTLFKKNIAAEIEYVFFGTNHGWLPKASSMKGAHEAQRRNGNVKMRRIRSGGRYEELISIGEREAYIHRKQANAGIAKGAWLEAGNDIGGPKVSKMGKWISRHATKGNGKAIPSGDGLNFNIELQNNVPYIDDIQTEYDLEKAAADGMKNGLNRMIKIIKKAEEKANLTT